jgi:hypothetical protein
MNIDAIIGNISPFQVIGFLFFVGIAAYFIYSYVRDLKMRDEILKKKHDAEAELVALNKEYAVKVAELEGQFAKRPKLQKRGK